MAPAPRRLRPTDRLGAVAAGLGDHPRHAVLGAMTAGLLVGRPDAVGGALAVAAATVAWGAAPSARIHPPAWWPLAVGAALLLGAWAADARTAALDRTALRPLYATAVAGPATLLEAPRRSPFGFSCLALWRGEPVLVRVRRGSAAATLASLGTGDVVAVRGRLAAPSAFARGRRAHAELRADVISSTGATRGGLAGTIDGVRRRSERALGVVLPPAEGALFAGMVLGEDAHLPDDLRADFRTTGLTHLVAASGTNVALLASIGMAVGRGLRLALEARAVLVLALIAGYVPLAGAGPSIQRAGIMGAATLAAVLAGRRASRWWALLGAATGTLLLDPRSAADAGWQLSFAAVLGLFVLAPRWSDGLRRRGIPPPVAEALAMTLAATATTAPVLAVHFGRVSVVSVPANVLAAALVAPIMWLGVAAAAVGQLSPVLAVPFVALAAFPLGCLVAIAHAGAGLPHATIGAGPWPVLAACIGLLAFERSARLQRLMPAAAPVVALTAVLFLRPPGGTVAGTPAGLRVTALDIGQGDATLVQDGPHAVLFDAGPPGGGILGALRRAGVRRLDVLVVTHAQADHDGGAADVLRAIPTRLVLDGRDGVASPDGSRMAAAAARRHVRLLAPDAGQVLRAGPIAIRVLSPRREPAELHAGADPNARAIVAEVEDGAARLLLTADAESDVLAGLPLRPVDVLKVAHHGSADPGLPFLLARLRPKVAVVEVGSHNPYGHPAPPTLSALRLVPRLLRTDRDGTVRLDLVRGRWEVRTDG